MRNKRSITARACAGFAASIFSFAWISVSAAELARVPNPQVDFRSVAESNLLVFGPVDLVDPANERVQILGQWISLSQSSVSQRLEGLAGHVLAAFGSISANGSFIVEAVSEQSSIDYVPGATHLYLKGSIAQIDSLHGTARIGSLSVNYSNALHSLAAEDLSVGTVVSFSGLQFAGTNKLFADNGLVHPNANVVRSLGQTGSGASALGQTGSGASALGQTGSGASALGQTGSGFHALGQTGSGASALGQTGSGFHALGQTGSGASALGQTGSGAKTVTTVR